METKEKSGLKLKKSALIGLVLLGPEHVGRKVELEVLRNVTERNRVVSEAGRESYILNFKAIAPDKQDQLKAVFEGREEVDIEETDGIFVTGNNWINNGELSTPNPMRGEKVDAMIGEVADRDSQAVIRVVSFKTRAAVKAATIKLEDFFAKKEVPAAPATEALAGELKTA